MDTVTRIPNARQSFRVIRKTEEDCDFISKLFNYDDIRNNLPRLKEHEYNIADQIQRSGTSIGANHREAIAAESDVDFVHKLAVAQKECNETLYWLELLKETGYIDEQMFTSFYADAEEIMRMLTASIITVKKRLKK